MATNPLPTQERLRQLLRYEPETGKLYWLPRTADTTPSGSKGIADAWNNKFAGKHAGTPGTRGYLIVYVAGKKYAAHRLIWKMCHGEDPGVIDHINGITNDNRISNLRSVSQLENCRNVAQQNKSVTGYTGVTWNARNRKWDTRIKVEGRATFIGYFETLQDAATARRFAERMFGFHPNHGRRPQ